MGETAVNSFVLRFVQELAAQGDASSEGGSAEADWHGVIRHVQSNTELRFVQIDEALAFMATYVPLSSAGIPNSPAGDSI